MPGPFGKKSLRAKLSPERLAVIENFRPIMSRAIKVAENNKKNHGVLSIPTADAGEASDVVNNSIINNFVRWDTGMPTIESRPNETRAVAPKFVDFMQKRWAPIGAENDPDNLNQNWAPNVRSYLKKKLSDDEYKALEDLDLVMRGQLPLDAQGGAQWEIDNVMYPSVNSTIPGATNKPRKEENILDVMFGRTATS